jgi:CHAD domain-containing protein
MTRVKLRAHELVKPAVIGLELRIRNAAERVVKAQSDGEAVHDFRVGLRRLRTVLRAARALYGKRRVKELMAQFKRFGDATNSLRDEEVLAETLEPVDLDESQRAAVLRWLSSREALETTLRKGAIDVIDGPWLDEAFASLQSCIGRGPKHDETAAAFAKSRLKEARSDVRTALPVTRSDTEGLHRLRIRFKRLRYTSEMLGRFMTQADATAALRREPRRPDGANYAAVARLAARMQKVLGQLHDADQAVATLRADEQLEPHVREGVLLRLGVQRGKLADEAIARLEELPDEMFGRAVRR